ncbi:hypothetical protein [Acinetobacter sp. YH12058]|uniref:hypothetical protein n=1 Tax=Acinetobacter sp. YH12058 TaxID=2601058 RepID=UPI0015D42231|nr:hypothetical protein [Acinetobacter sp. YH12058]
MTKITKFVKNPKGFFADFLKKRETSTLLGGVVNQSNKLSLFIEKYSSNAGLSSKNVSASVSPVAVKTATRPPVASMNYQVNFFKKHVAILHSGEGAKAGLAHLNLWIPSFLESNIDFIVLVRDLALYNAIKQEYPWLNIAFVKRPIDIEEFIAKLPFVKTVFYPSSTGNNIHLVRFSFLNHVFIGHGDSDKASSAHKGLRLYDEVWTAGEAHIDRFKNASFNSDHIVFKKVGRPNSFKTLIDCQQHWTERKFNFLYLPTWEGFMEEANYSSIHLASEILNLITAKYLCKISAKFHPLTGNRDLAYQNLDIQLSSTFPDQLDTINIIDKSINLEQVLSLSNIFICDISAVISECLAANGPIFVYIPKDKVINIAASNMRYEDYCYAFSDINQLDELLYKVLSGDDYLVESRKKAIDYLIGYEETLNKEFVNQLKSLEAQDVSSLPSRAYDF